MSQQDLTPNDGEGNETGDSLENTATTADAIMAGPSTSHRRGRRSIFEEACEMLAISILTYGIAEFRKLVRDGKITRRSCEKSGLPMKLSDAAHNLSLHLEDVKREIEPATFDLYMTGANLVVERLLNLRIEEEEETMLMVFDDERSERELVFSIMANPKDRRITVSFRGSVTIRDLLIDSKVSLVQIPNPVEPGTTVGIHCGFRDYMYGKTARYGQALRGGERRKIDSICDQLFDVVDQYPQYRIFITGHSLGGALATLLAFELGAKRDDRIRETISCVSFASPRVGNLAFANAFQSLERTKRIRCLCVANEKDIFPEIPRTGTKNPCGIICFGDRIYRHVGVSFSLLRDGGYNISFPEHYQHPVRLFFRDWFNSAQNKGQSLGRLICRENLTENHSCMQYWARLNLNQSALQKVHLDEVYGRLVQRRGSALTGK